jgi:hypothetical protein
MQKEVKPRIQNTKVKKNKVYFKKTEHPSRTPILTVDSIGRCTEEAVINQNDGIQNKNG